MTHEEQRAHRGAPRDSRSQPVGMDQGMTALSYLISGVLLWGGLGWLGDHFLGLGFLLPIGIVVGAGFGCYMIICRFGALPTRSTSSTWASTTDTPSVPVAAVEGRQETRGEESPWAR